MNAEKALERVRHIDTSLADPDELSRFRQFLAILCEATERYGLKRKDAERLAACEVFGHE